MKLTPLDIKKQEFKNTFRGYDPMEVETFLEMVADEYEELATERNKFKEEILTLQTQLKDYQQVEQTLKQTLMNAQESVNRARVNTEKEANLILHEAELKAEKLLEKARRDLETMKNELVIVRAQKESFAKRLKHLLESQIELIKVLEIDDSELGTKKVEFVPEKIPEKNDEKAAEIIKEVKEVDEVQEIPKLEEEKIEPEIKQPTEVDLLKASSISVAEEKVGNQTQDVTDKLEEFLQKKEEEDLAKSPVDLMNDRQEKREGNEEILGDKENGQILSPEVPSEVSPDKIIEKEIDSTQEKQPTTLEEFIQEQSQEPPKIPDESDREQKVSKDKKIEEPTQKPSEQNDLFKKQEEDQQRKRSFPENDDQMVF